MRAGHYCWLPTLAMLLLAFARVSRGDEGPFPRPAADAVAKAEVKVREVYKGDLAKAVKPTEKAALAGALLSAAESVGLDDGSRYVLLTLARDLAVGANDARLAMKAVNALVSRFQPDGPTDAKEQIERGNAPWKEAESAPADKRLGLKVQAAEWYLRARPIVTGLDEVLIAKRLAELGETAPPDNEHVAVVAAWEHHAKGRKGRGVSATVSLLSDGHFKASGTPERTYRGSGSGGTWERKRSTLILRWGHGGVDICTLSSLTVYWP